MIARALCSVDTPEKVKVIEGSTWEPWEDLEQHRSSGMVEEKVLLEFESEAGLENLTTQVYEEVA